MARLLGAVRPSWCWVCHARPGRDCPDRGRSVRQQKRREAQAWRRGAGLVQVVRVDVAPVPYPVNAQHPPTDFDG